MRNFVFVIPLLGPLLGIGIAACGGADTYDVNSDSPQPASTVDGGGGPDAIGPKPDGGPQGNCDPSKCGVSAPAGWKLATAQKDRTAACSDGWKSTDVVSDPVADPAACACDCNVTQTPTCGGGQVLRNLDQGNATCGQMATTLNMTGGGACDPFNNFFIVLQGKNYQTIPPKPKGGTCQFDSKADPTKVTASLGRICEPPASCQGDICKMQNICITHEGDIDCLAEYPNKRLVGAAPKLECAACGGGCDVKGDCTGTLSMYTDGNCTQGKIDFTADSQCDPAPNGNNQQYRSASLTTSVKSPGCVQTPTSAATVKLDAPTTVCCKN